VPKQYPTVTNRPGQPATFAPAPPTQDDAATFNRLMGFLQQRQVSVASLLARAASIGGDLVVSGQTTFRKLNVVPGVTTLASLVVNGTTTLKGRLTGQDAIFSQVVQALDFAATGLAGSTAASRWTGATASGAPTASAHTTADFNPTQDGNLFVCSAGGTPGTWLLQRAAKLFGLGTSGNMPLAGTAPTSPFNATQLLIQADSVTLTTNGSGDVTVSFPTAFPNSFLGVVISNGDRGTGSLVMDLWPGGSNTLSSFAVRVFVSNTGATLNNTPVRVQYIAIGT